MQRFGHRLSWVWFVVLATSGRGVLAQTELDHTVNMATTVLDEIMSIPARQIPAQMLANAEGVAIIPNVVKGGFVLGVRHGRGVVVVRDEAGQWQAPLFASLTGGSVGWQVGLQATDVILVFRTRKSLDGLMQGKLTIGADAAAAAGPVGRQAAAATDARLGAEILSYSRSRGLFAGVSIDGSMLQLDHALGQIYYQQPALSSDGSVVDAVPESAMRLVERLSHYSGSAVVVEAPLVQGGMPPAGGVPGAVSGVRGELVAAWRTLADLLDDEWRNYLSIPAGVALGKAVDAAELRRRLERYDKVASDPDYTSLSGRAEFVRTRDLLAAYLAEQTAVSSKPLSLPRPPGRQF